MTSLRSDSEQGPAYQAFCGVYLELMEKKIEMKGSKQAGINENVAFLDL